MHTAVCQWYPVDMVTWWPWLGHLFLNVGVEGCAFQQGWRGSPQVGVG